jgi:hypothetical protein
LLVKEDAVDRLPVGIQIAPDRLDALVVRQDVRLHPLELGSRFRWGDAGEPGAGFEGFQVILGAGRRDPRQELGERNDREHDGLRTAVV